MGGGRFRRSAGGHSGFLQQVYCIWNYFWELPGDWKLSCLGKFSMKCLCRIKQFNLFFQVSSDGTNHNQWNFHSRSLIVSIIVWKALVFIPGELWECRGDSWDVSSCNWTLDNEQGHQWTRQARTTTSANLGKARTASHTQRAKIDFIIW